MRKHYIQTLIRITHGGRYEWGVFCEFKVWFIFCSWDCRAVCNTCIMIDCGANITRSIFFKILTKYSRITLSRAPLTRENQLVGLAPWTPNFSDAPLATTHMTDQATHMCWSEQISPLVHSSQATWHHFNLSHCTIPTCWAAQDNLIRLFHTFGLIFTLRNQPLTVNKQWPPLRESRMSRHTRFNTSRKTETAMHGIFLDTNTLLQVDTTHFPED